MRIAQVNRFLAAAVFGLALASSRVEPAAALELCDQEGIERCEQTYLSAILICESLKDVDCDAACGAPGASCDCTTEVLDSWCEVTDEQEPHFVCIQSMCECQPTEWGRTIVER
jgi:hypothetical protein